MFFVTARAKLSLFMFGINEHTGRFANISPTYAAHPFSSNQGEDTKLVQLWVEFL